MLVEEERSILWTDGGLPLDVEREEPRTGGGDGRETVDGEDNGTFCEELCRTEPIRRDGGGGGARPLSDRGRVFSVGGVNVALEDSSSGFGDNLDGSLKFRFESGTFWLCRRASGGAGAAFLRKEADGDGGSGVLPAASLSNIDSRSESWLARLGAGGSGLFRSVCDRGLELK